MKICRRCNIEKEPSLFCTRKASKDGLSSYCKECERARTAERRATNPESVKASSAKYAEKNADIIADRKKDYRIRNYEKCKLARKVAYEKNKVRELARSAEYKALHKAELSEKYSAKRKANPYLNRFYRSERRASERMAKPIWYRSEKVREMCMEASKLSSDSSLKWHVDHIVPLKSDLVCGLHWHGNMQVITSTENQSKSNRHWPDMP